MIIKSHPASAVGAEVARKSSVDIFNPLLVEQYVARRWVESARPTSSNGLVPRALVGEILSKPFASWSRSG